MEEKTKEKVETTENVVEKNIFKRIWTEMKDFKEYVCEDPSRLASVGAGIAGFVGTGLTIFGIISRFWGGGNSCEVPDEITGLNYRTSHPLTNAEILELSDRMVDGETTGEALNNMGVLKTEKKKKK